MTASGRPEARVQITLRWRDMDELGHLNQSVYHELIEEGRAALLESLVSDTESYVIAGWSSTTTAEVLRTDGTVEIVVRVAPRRPLLHRGGARRGAGGRHPRRRPVGPCSCAGTCVRAGRARSPTTSARCWAAERAQRSHGEAGAATGVVGSPPADRT